jgi:hypothetical protein
MGLMLDADGAARAVYGVPGSATLGEVLATGVLSFGCSRVVCLLKTDSSVVSMSEAGTQATDAPPGPALFSVEGDRALVYFPWSRQLARWHRGQLDYLEFSAEVLAMREAKGSVELAVRSGGRVAIVRDGEVLEFLPDDAEPVLLLGDAVLFATGDALVLRRPDGTETKFDVTDVDALFLLGDRFVQVNAGGLKYALRVEPGREGLFLLPEAPP